MNELFHYGIQGMKWGVRRYQNPDGTRTAAGKKRELHERRVKSGTRTTKDANEIVKSLTKHEKDLLGASQHEDWIDAEREIEETKSLAKRIVQYDMKDSMKTPVSFIEIWDNNDGKAGQIAIATKSGDEYRGKGYASKSVQQGLDWYNRYGYKKLKYLEWIAEKTNTGSNNLAKKMGFIEADPYAYGWAPGSFKDYNYYVYKKGVT